ncbi:MAG: hypothetical protein IJZ85_01555 [Lachnospiraceae bacterium]|nr:hypothetical protein [Lachnospiraceae bacterium]
MRDIWDSIVNFFQTEWAKLKPMSFNDKLVYIWEYYKLHIIIFLTVLISTISIINTVRENRAGGEVVFGVAIVNDMNGNDAAEQLATEFGDYLGLVYGEQCVQANGGYSVGNTGMDYYEVSSILMMVDAGAGNVDVAICQENALQYFENVDDVIWMDLNDIIGADRVAELGDRIFYYTNADGESFPCGIYIKDHPVLAAHSSTLKEPMVVFPAAARHVEYMDDFVDYILGE